MIGVKLLSPTPVKGRDLIMALAIWASWERRVKELSGAKKLNLVERERIMRNMPR